MKPNITIHELTSIKQIDGRNWLWQCSCGKQKKIRTSHVKSGNTKSCGCVRIASLPLPKKIHGHACKNKKSPEYWAWTSMIQRCYNSKCSSFHNYGGRGILVCDTWRKSFQSFFADMGSRPSPEHSLDRIDNMGNYTPSNCKWSTKSEQAKNRRRLHPKSIQI